MASPAESTKSESTKHHESVTANDPVVVDLGKKRRKQIRRLRKGHGKLMDQVNHLLDELRGSGSFSPTAQPVVVVVREKRRTRSIWP